MAIRKFTKLRNAIVLRDNNFSGKERCLLLELFNCHVDFVKIFLRVLLLSALYEQSNDFREHIESNKVNFGLVKKGKGNKMNIFTAILNIL